MKWTQAKLFVYFIGYMHIYCYNLLTQCRLERLKVFSRDNWRPCAAHGPQKTWIVRQIWIAQLSIQNLKSLYHVRALGLCRAKQKARRTDFNSAKLLQGPGTRNNTVWRQDAPHKAYKTQIKIKATHFQYYPPFCHQRWCILGGEWRVTFQNIKYPTKALETTITRCCSFYKQFTGVVIV